MRWHAIVYYRTENGSLNVEHDFEELRELHALIELGPHWDTIEQIVISLARHADDPTLTVERSEQL